MRGRSSSSIWRRRANLSTGARCRPSSPRVPPPLRSPEPPASDARRLPQGRATTTLPRYAAGRETWSPSSSFSAARRASSSSSRQMPPSGSTRLLQDYFGWHGMLVDEANYGQIVRRAPCADGKCTTLASLSKQLPNSRINLMAIDATRDASPLPLLQTIDWSVVDASSSNRARWHLDCGCARGGRRAACWARRAHGARPRLGRVSGVRWFVSLDILASPQRAPPAPGRCSADRTAAAPRRVACVCRQAADRRPRVHAVRSGHRALAGLPLRCRISAVHGSCRSYPRPAAHQKARRFEDDP